MADGAFGGGAGTQGDPLLVEDFADLNAVRDDLTAWYKLVAHVNLDGFSWDPIGSPETSFTGGFDGNGYTISDLTIDEEGHDNIGFFGAVDHADSILENITIEDATVVGADTVGTLVAYLEAGTVRNCRVIGISSLVGSPSAGGLIGFAQPGTHVEDSYATIDVSASSDEFGDGDSMGGFIGLSWGTVERCGASGNIVGGLESNDVGGFAGTTSGNGSIDECFAIGNVSGRTWTGGFIGTVMDPVTNCYATGDVTIYHGWSGGFAGAAFETVTNCYFAGDIIDEGGEDNEVHGFMGEGGDYAVSCYFNSEVSGIDYDVSGSQATAASTEELQTGTAEPWYPQRNCLHLVHTMDAIQRTITWPGYITWIGGAAPVDPAPEETIVVKLLNLGLTDKSETWFAEVWDFSTP